MKDIGKRLSILPDMQERFLIIDKSGIRLLGYPLRLTPTEAKLLTLITERGEASVELLCTLLSEGVSRQNVAVHISAINRKAERISGRKLVCFKNNLYGINPCM